MRRVPMPTSISARVINEAALQERPGSSALHADLGIIYSGLGQNERAIEHAQRATTLVPIRQDPTSGYSLVVNLARVQARVGDLDGAVATLNGLVGHGRMHSRTLFESAFGFEALRGHSGFLAFLEELDRTVPQL